MSQTHSSIKPIFVLLALLQEPLTCLQTIVPLFLLKELHASTYEIALLTSLLPTAAILSFYWGSFLHTISSSKKLMLSLVLSTSLTPLLFLVSWTFTTPWLFIIASSWYTLFLRASQPAKMELLKRLFPKETCNAFFSSLFRLSYALGMILGPVFGILCDKKILVMSWLFSITALLHLLSSFLYILLPLTSEQNSPNKLQLSSSFSLPWKTSLKILKENKQFMHFQIGFFIAGFGLMIAKPAGDMLLYQLQLPYLFLFMCRIFLKGSGTIGSSKIWSAQLTTRSILSIASYVTIGFLLFQGLLIGSLFSTFFVAIAYCIYGIAQGGSHLVWHLSGPLLSGETSSCQYSAINILAVGIRGCIAPLLGGILFAYYGAVPTIAFGSLCIGCGTFYLQRTYKETLSTPLPT